MPIDNKKRAIDRFRPEVALGGIVEALSLPQQAPRSDADAVQKHQVTDVTAQVSSDAYRMTCPTNKQTKSER